MEISYPGAVAPARSRFVRSLGLRIHVCEWGDPEAEPVILTHGFYDHARGFDLLAPRLAERYRVLAIDSRGHGDSDWADEYSWPTDILDVIHVLRDLGRPAHLVGHSRGGGLATDAAILDPGSVRKLVNLDGFGPPEEGFEIPGRAHETRTPPENLAWYLDWRQRSAARSGFRPAPDVGVLAERRQAQNPRLSLDWLRYFASAGSRRTEDGYVWKFDPFAGRGMGPFRPEWIAPNWTRLRVPMLAVVGGVPDTWGPLPEPMLSKRLAHVPRLDRAVVEGAGHFMHIEKPEETARLILDWLEDAV